MDFPALRWSRPFFLWVLTQACSRASVGMHVMLDMDISIAANADAYAASSLRCIRSSLEFCLWLVGPNVGDQVWDVLHFIR